MKFSTRLLLLVIITASNLELPTSNCHAQTPVLYGMTPYGGANNKGAIISFNPTTNTESVVWSFNVDTGGYFPDGNLVYNTNNGLFYGLAFYGGIYNTGAGGGSGTIFSFNPTSNQAKTLWNLGNGSDAAYPEGSLVYDSNNGLYYGMTKLGGLNNLGAIFSFNPTNNAEETVWSFGTGTDGQNPRGSLVLDASGLLYGLTFDGGSNNLGAIISFNPTTKAENVVWNFAGSTTDGANPESSLVYDTNTGLYYGTTSQKGSNSNGTIISFNANNNKEKLVWSFSGNATDGGGPNGDIAFDANSKLFYLFTSDGGTTGMGTITSFNTTTAKDSLLWSLGKGTDGAVPNGSLTYDPTTALFYGMTSGGGTNATLVGALGAIISFNPATNRDSLLWSFGSGADGYYPTGSLTLYTPGSSTGINSINSSSSAINIYPNPSNGSFIITALSKGAVIEIYNYIGQKVSTVVASNGSQQLNISNLANGIYLVRVLDANGNVIGERNVVKE